MYFDPLVIPLVTSVTSATTGASATLPTGKSIDAVRYVVSSSGSTTATVDIETSIDGTIWAKAIAQISNPGTANTTGVIAGPIRFLRAVTAGSTHGTITVQAYATLNP